MKLLVDTHVVSGGRKDELATIPDGDWSVSSVALQELFLMQDSGSGYRYATPSIHSHAVALDQSGITRLLRDHARKRPVPGSADRIALDCGGDFPSRYEIGHRTISSTLNRRERSVLQGCCSVLPKWQQRIVLAEFDFLVDRHADALPLVSRTAQSGLELLKRFLTPGRSPKGNLRNTLNDMFLLSQSQHSQLPLLSDDTVLGEFGREVGCQVSTTGDLVIIDPLPQRLRPKRLSRESKGYINSQWRATQTR